MKQKKYKILMLSDLKEGTNSTLKNTISLSKMINADIEFFHVKKPTDIVETDSQLSAMRTITKEHIMIEKKIKNLIAPISEEYDVNINSSFTFGNVKNEIENAIKSAKPDVIVLGKRKQKTLGFIGDNITGFVLNAYRGPVMMASASYGLAPEKELSLGFYNNKTETLNLRFADELIDQTEQPLKSFNIVDSTNDSREKLVSSTNKTVDYVFEKNDNALKTLSSYLVKNKVNLLCIDRGDQTNNKLNVIRGEIKDVVNKVNISLFLTNETSYSAN
nr:universal stress protein [uncultured Psychroserpens sp.]